MLYTIAKRRLTLTNKETNMAKFGDYTVGCGVEDRIERVLREDGRLVAVMFDNGEILHEDHDERFEFGWQLWNVYADWINDIYGYEVKRARLPFERKTVYKTYHNQAKAYYYFCFGKSISDALLNEVVPVEWAKKVRQ
jgi:hypothetical protein